MKETFDDILRRRWEEQHFPVDESHRDAMREMLHRKEKKRGFLWWWLGGTAVVMTMAWWLLTDTQSLQAPAVPAVPKPKTELTERQPATDHETLSRTNDPSLAEAAVGKSPLSERSVTKPVTKSNRQPAEPKAGKSTKRNAQSVARTSGDYYQVELDRPNEARIPSNTVGVNVYPDSVQFDPWTGRIYDGLHRYPVITTPLQSLLTAGLEPSAAETEPMGMLKPSRKFTHHLRTFVETGVGFVFGSRPVYEGGLKVNAGAGLDYSLDNKLKVLWSAGYLMQDGGFAFERTSTVTQASFGVRSQFNSLSPDRLHFVYSRIGAQYQLRRHLFSAGAQWQYLYGAQGHITVQGSDQLTGAEQPVTRYAWLKTDGLNKTQWCAQVSYGYRLTPRLVAQAGTAYYFTSIVEDNPVLSDLGYDWNGSTATWQPFVTLNYLLYAIF